MQIQAALIREQGQTFSVVVAKKHILHNRLEADRLAQYLSPAFGGVPVVLMAQDGSGRPSYYGRSDIVRFLENVPIQNMPWRQYTLN